MEASRSEKEIRDRLLKSVKKEVKQIMEEAVTRKFVHEESSSITSLCGAVETCVQYGLKKRTLGLFKNNNSTSALLTKISKSYEPATQVTKILNDLDVNANEAKKSIDNNKNQTGNLKKTPSNYNPKYLWIRLALFEKVLAGIIDHLAQNNSKYYEKESVLADPVDGPILASLLVGPCALDFTKMKTTDHFWTDPPADELVQRHRIHSSGNHYQGPGSPRKLGLQVRMNPSLSSDEGSRASPLSAKEYVESLHQNSKTTLLYGKNNVMVQPFLPMRKENVAILSEMWGLGSSHNQTGNGAVFSFHPVPKKEDVERMAGYLSLHQGVEGLSVKWTPNQLMNGCCELDENGEDVDRSLYWEYAVTVYLDEIVYLHCHQQPDSGGTIVLVGQDGVQRPPIHFPKGGHLLAFLSCLETGLLPHGQLDPPLWSQRGKEEELPSFPAFLAQLESKVFPKLLRKGSQRAVPGQKSESLDEAEVMTCDAEEATDYVFRIISTFRPENLHADLMDPKNIRNGSNTNGSNNWAPRDKLRHTSSSSSTSSTASIQSYARNQQQVNATMLLGQGQGTGTHHRCAVKQLCDTMKRQIISRAFYGWLAHCRHLKTVRTHLSGLVNHQVISVEEPCDASKGLTAEIWLNLFHDGVVTDVQEVYRLVYYGGVEHSIRKEVWPFLLGHYKFGSTVEEREQLATETRQQYENTMSEWLAVEAIVRQRDKEIMAANFAKLSSESQDGQIPLVRKDSSLSNDVFEDNYSMTSDDVDRDFQGNEPESLAEEGAVSLDSSKIQTPESLDEGVGDMTKTLKSQRSCDSTTTDRSIIVTNPSVDSGSGTDAGDGEQEQTVLPSTSSLEKVTESPSVEALGVDIEEVLLNASRESLVSPASPASNGGIYSTEMLESVALNLHRIDKDVQRCDRNYFYFNRDNLEKLKNVMCTYVWEHLEIGYVQGMCDLVAPLLVIFDDEALTYSCFCELMKRMTANFPHGGAMDIHFANMRSLIQILDSELFEHMHQNGDYTHFYFCYRWFLLDFKRELVYDDVFVVWETIWSAKYISSSNFVLFIALALVEYYREIILDNNMDFTDIIKFFNEMAERHNAKQVLKISRDLVHRLQDLIENK